MTARLPAGTRISRSFPVSTPNSMKTLEPKMSSPSAGPRPVSPYGLHCRFDRSRGEFVVHAGARAGGLAVVAVALLGVGALGFVGDAIRDTSSQAAAQPAAVAFGDDEPEGTATPGPVASARGNQSKTASSQSGSSRAFAAMGGRTSHARQPGLNYLVLQSFPNEREATAAQAALEAKGVSTTVERNLAGWAGKGWYSVVGTTGFDMSRQRREFDRHVKDLKSMKLNPKPYKWRGPEVASGR